MYSLSARFNQILFFTSVVLGFASFLNQATSYFIIQGVPTANIVITKIEKFGQNIGQHYNGGYQDWEYVNMRFNLTSDLNPLFTWNLKQLFVFINVEFINPENNYTSNNIVYDKIIQVPDNKKHRERALNVSLNNVRVEYPLRDVYKKLQGQTVKIQLWTEIMPHVGIIYRQKIHEEAYQLPQDYIYV